MKRYAARELGPGWGEAIRFEAPSGHTVELGHGMEKVGNMLPLFNPPPRPGNLVGIAPPRLDHVFIMAEDVEAATAFYTEVLEFRLTEQIMGNDGHQIATWMERSHTPHDLAIDHRARTARCTTSRSGSTTGTPSAKPPTPWPTTA